MDPYNDLGRYGSNKVADRRPCPRCRAGGGDRNGDNLVVYMDGHEHCYACGLYNHAPVTMDNIRKLVEQKEMQLTEFEKHLDFPRDCVPLLEALWAKEPVHWLRSYGITDDEIKRFSFGWSRERLQLIMPYYNSAGVLEMYQARNFSGFNHIKYVTKGAKSNVMHLVGNSKSDTCVVTEDLISAIKVGRTFQAMPLWGADMALGLIEKVAKRFGELGIWLDRNKAKESVKIALRASQYLPTFVVSTELDPKEYSDDAIATFIWKAQKKDMVYQDNDFDPKAWEKEVEAARKEMLIVPGPNPEPSMHHNPGLLLDVNGHPYNYGKDAHGS